MPYKFEKDELLKLLIRVYNEGNCGFLDLAESVSEKLIEENNDKYFEHTPYVSSFSCNPDIFPGSITINNELGGDVSVANLILDQNLSPYHSNQIEINV